MVNESVSMQVTVVGSEDGKETYEIRRSWDASGKKALLLHSLRPG